MSCDPRTTSAILVGRVAVVAVRVVVRVVAP